MTTTSYIFVVILSIYILKEKLNKNKIIGISLILIGIVIFNIKI
ncbi:EamA family transporter [[Clostridium] innocuum]|nr:EamA family transporter [[Clostridium] innocuum]